ncbi:class I adenylate-forming enzyme family protein [Acrocarpospora catenulata]|uniref:class I adenylate-forming enzyme family protein n=1 Tax=Acrocarpospora catenulata TaxID=2836182 RepID=UPI001BDA40FD|nr:class I adenylate-forming enzyme family protein [Acrocarpospora catenulata]
MSPDLAGEQTPFALADLARRRRRLEESIGAWAPMSIDQRLDASAARWPDRAYLIFDDDSHTYADTARRSREIAATLAAAGVGPGAHVGLLMGNCFDFYAATFAISRLGGWVVPLNYLLAPVELAFVLRQSQCSVVVVDPDVPVRDGVELFTETLAAGGEEGFPHLRQVFVVPADFKVTPSFAHAPFTPGAASYDGDSLADPHDTSHLFYTSGSTALPKGVTETHDAMLREAYGTALCRAYDDGWRVMTALPTFHIFGLMQCVFASMFVGGAAVVEKTFDAEHQLAQVERHRVRDIVSVPAMSQRLVAAAEGKDYDLSSLTALFTAGNAVPAASWMDIRRVLGATELGTGYGMTEAPGITFIARPEDPLEVLTDTVGRAKVSGAAGLAESGGRQHRCLIVDLDTGEPVPDGQDGEILISGPTVTRGYWDNDLENVKSFRDGYLRTGDVGHLRADGCLVLTGRVKEMYKSGGENVTPKEVEAALYTHPAVGQAVVVGVPDPKWGETGCAWIVPVAGVAVTPEELVEHCRTRLARYKVPRHVFIISAAELPLTGMGKLKRQDLVAMAAERGRDARSRKDSPCRPPSSVGSSSDRSTSSSPSATT